MEWKLSKEQSQTRHGGHEEVSTVEFSLKRYGPTMHQNKLQNEQINTTFKTT